MPEGPEIWILSKAINTYYSNKNTQSYGKHLFLKDVKENWSFGLTGTVAIGPDNKLAKVPSGWLHGSVVAYDDLIVEQGKLGIDFMTADEEELKCEIGKWASSKKKLAGLLLDQTKISGIGVAWGSEILFNAGLRPEARACDQNLDKLADSIFYIRKMVKDIYEKELKDNEPLLKKFIDNWFKNLYEVRQMSVYKKGTQIEVLGRKWWI